MSTSTRDGIVNLLLPVRGVGQRVAESIAEAFDDDLDSLLAATEAQLTAIPRVGKATAKAIREQLARASDGRVHTPVEALAHDERRKNIPTDQLSQLVAVSGSGEPALTLYPRNPELDPQLVWRGKDALDSGDLQVPVVPVYIQEKIVPQAIVENLRDTANRPEDEPELSLFDDFDGLTEDAAFDFYQHDANWSNRMILGDALVTMTSLAEKENLKGKVQTIYVDPPYGIKFNSNWQMSTSNRNVNEKLEDLTRQPEQIRAFRDTWKDGVHSYLTNLRDRLQVAHTLLSVTGSIFVQIGDENVHVVRSLLDETFGPENFVSQIGVTKTTGATNRYLAGAMDYILWYARDAERMKYRQLYKPKELGGEGAGMYTRIELPDGTRRPMTTDERKYPELLPEGARPYRHDNLKSQSMGRKKGYGAASWFDVTIDGITANPGPNSRWKTNEDGMERLIAARRVEASGSTPAYVRFLDDFPAFPINNAWTEFGGEPNRIYVVQTNTRIVERCILMTTDPGDLVLDPTSGSGTTAYVAEKWGRRWIVVDTSRVAQALARARIMGGRYPYWLLADSRRGAEAEAKELGRDPVSPEGGYGDDVRKGFVYKRALHVMLSTIARCEDIKPGISAEEVAAAIRRVADSEVLYDQPYEDRSIVRVAGPFTVESLSPHRTIDPSMSVAAGEWSDNRPGAGEATPAKQDFGETVLENLKRAGVQNGYRNERMELNYLEPYADGGWVAATGTYSDADGAEHLVAVSIGPEHGTVGREQVNQAAREAVRIGAEIVLVCGFAFDGGATDEAADASSREFPVVGERRVGRVRVLNVRINADLMMDEDLKSTGAGNLFMVFGEPDIRIRAEEGRFVATLHGVDVYDPVNNEVRSSGPEDAMAWFIDTDYDENQFFVRHAYFTGDTEQFDPYEQLKRALNAEISHDAWSRLHSTTSLPFRRPSTGKIAVKVINHYGDEVLKVFAVPAAR